MTAPPTRLLFLPLMTLLLGTACEEEKPLPTFLVTFTSHSDDAPLAGTQILADGNPIGFTGEDGRLQVQIRGREGRAVTIAARCPTGHRQPGTLPNLMLRSFQGLDPAAASRGIETRIACPPSHRRAAILVRAEGQANLPIVMDGREVARTNEAGIAHLMLNLEPESTFRVEFDTSENEGLRPQNPGQVFTLGDRDDVFVLNQVFEERRRRRRRTRTRRPSGPMLPTQF